MTLRSGIYALAAIALLMLGCTKVSIVEELPDTAKLTPLTISTDLPVVNLSMPRDSFDVLYEKYLDKIRYKGRFTYYSRVGAAPGPVDLDCLVDIRGRTSSKYPLKSLGIEFDTPVDNVKWRMLEPEAILPGDDLGTLKNLRLRNSGNDFGHTMLKDLVYTRFIVDMSLDLELRYGTPVQVFVNEQYYGLLNLRTENDRQALGNLFQVDTSALVIMKMDGDNGNLEPEEGDPLPAVAFRQALLAKDAGTLKSMLDMDNFLDYIIFEDYIGNDDWPDNNVSAYSIHGEPFRFFVYDLDYAAFRTKNAILPEMEFRDDDVSRIYQLLIQDEEFVDKLEKRQKELYSLFSPQRFNILLQQASEQIENDIRYTISKYHEPSSTLQWQLNLEGLKRDFERRDHYMREKYGMD